MSDGAAPRAAAARVITAVLHDGRSLDDALAEQQQGFADNDRALVSALAHGVLRDRRWLAALLQPLLKRPPQPGLEALLTLGLYQLRAMRIPAHAAVHATVAAAPALGLGKARGMVNAVLRRCQRDMSRLERAAPATAAVRYSCPDWLAGRLAADWPDQYEALLAANNERAPMHVRVNRRMTTRTALQQALGDAGIETTQTACACDGLTLARPLATSLLPGFDRGRVSVQDGAAQQAADVLALANGQRVLDACAAPGNKTAHMLERADIDLLALDADPERAQMLRANLARLRLSAGVRAADAARSRDWWDGRAFDRILLDAPCSGTGVIRRHPDIKWLRRPDDIDAAARRQRMLLDALWPLLAEDGVLVYAACSLLRAEGAEVVGAFLAATPEAQEQPIIADWGRPDTVGRTVATGENGWDGFYYARVRRQSGLQR